MRVDHEIEGDVIVLTVNAPRIDAAGAVGFKDAVRAATADHPGRVVLDVTQVEFLDSSGLGALVGVMKLIPGRKLELAGAGPIMRKVLALTKMDKVFVLHVDRHAALEPRDAA
ncbi:STAS domain-containing protein [Jannaschia sp. LMIT008]|uniref:STAS domain-containing protein n=1 Tax=Jannaschia maritima TaxID=3032585 RepID=UPI002811C7E2|nr:STAS domain-containing protein [Jannaschia sp. LMIT008]